MYNPNCTLCSLNETCLTVCVPGSGHTGEGGILLVGEAPGRNEDQLGRPFVGEAGNKLKELSLRANLPLEGCYITNAVKCRPPDNRTPTMAEIRACRVYLLREIDQLKPRLIIALGLVAVKALMNSGKAQLRETVGAPFSISGVPVYATYHPAAVLRFPHYGQAWVSHVAQAVTGVTVQSNPTEWEFLDPEEGDHGYPLYDDHMGKQSMIGFDTETYPGLNPWAAEARVRMISYAVCPGKGRLLDTPQAVWTLLDRAAFKLDNVVWKAGSNIKFDIKWLAIHVWPGAAYATGPYWDTKVAERLVCPLNDRRGLKALTMKYAPEMGAYAEPILALKQQRKGMQHITDAEMYEYSAQDADASLRVALGQLRLMRPEDIQLMWHYSRLIAHLARVELAGMKIDRLVQNELRFNVYGPRIAALQTKLREILGCNPDSPKQLAKALGVKSTGVAILKTLQQRPGVKELLEYRKITKLYRTYVAGIDKFIGPNDLLHGDFLIDGTDTGRLSSREPNLQNIAKAKDIRRMFVSRYGDDGCLMEIDFSQAEVWVAAKLSDDVAMLAALRSGEDFHARTAQTIYNKKEVTEAERRSAKATTFHIFYGGSDFGLSQRLGIPLHRATAWVRGFYSAYGGLHSWQIRQRRTARQNGYVETYFHRRYEFPKDLVWDTPQGSHYLRVAVNSPIQGTVGHLTQMAQMRLEANMPNKDCKVICQVHDSILLDVPGTDVIEVKRRVREVLDEFGMREIGVEMPYTVQVGPTWAEMGEKELYGNVLCA